MIGKEIKTLLRTAENKSTNKPKLLIILNRFVIGGQAVDTIPLVWHLMPHFDVLILFGEKEKDEIEPSFLLELYPGLRLKKIKQLRRSVNPFIDVLAFFHVLYVIITFKANIVHTHGAKSGFIGRVAAWIAGVPVIIHTFHGHFFHSYFSKTSSKLVAAVERWMGKITTAAVALSTIQKDDLVENYKILPASKIRIIPLGFHFEPVSNPAEQRSNFRKKYGLKDNDVAIGIVGRIVAIKNHSFFVRVAAQLLKLPLQNPVAFFIIGDGDLKIQVENELRRNNIHCNNNSITNDNRVVFTSWLTNTSEVMSGLDIIVLTSLNEGTPLSIIEAQYFKKPVVCTNVGGVKDTMCEGKSGFLVDNNDITIFTQKLHQLVEDKNLRNEMGEEGFDFASKKFCKQKEIEDTKTLYLNLLKEKKQSFF